MRARNGTSDQGAIRQLPRMARDLAPVVGVITPNVLYEEKKAKVRPIRRRNERINRTVEGETVEDERRSHQKAQHPALRIQFVSTHLHDSRPRLPASWQLISLM